jgi:hypothetical protein
LAFSDPDWENPKRRHTKISLLAAIICAHTLLPALFFLWMTSVPGKSYVGQLPPLDQQTANLIPVLRNHVVTIGSTPHNVVHPQALEAAASHIERTLLAYGYSPQRHPIETDKATVSNIEIVVEPGKPEAQTLVIGAHYDSFYDAPGANDNGTGTAALLELARRFADLKGHSKLRLRLVFFVNEEPPFFKTEKMGSLVYARALAKSGEEVKGMLSLETIGFYSDDEGSQFYPPLLRMRYPDTGNFVAFVGMLSSRAFVRETVADFRERAKFPSAGGSAPGALGGISLSDHWSFEKVGIPSLMITDTAPFRYRHYHSKDDTPDKIDYERLARVTAGIESVVRNWATN